MWDAYIEASSIFATAMKGPAVDVTKMERIYLDHAATMPMLPASKDAMLQGFESWANPSSPHGDGRAAKAALEAARADIAGALDWDGEILFTSGASEAVAMCFAGGYARKNNSYAAQSEHDCVMAALKDAGGDTLALSGDGYVEKAAISDAGLYAIQAVNSESGVIQNFGEIRRAVNDAGGVWLCDCAQAAGKIALPDADMIVVSAHKVGGPPGVGALLIRDLALLHPSGGQEQGYRRGTENLPAIAAFAAALQQGAGWMEDAAEHRQWLDAQIQDAGGEIVAADSNRIASIASYRMPGVSANSQLISFDMAGISVSAGSACSSGTLKSSHVLAAMGWDEAAAGEVIRVSFGPQTDREDVERFFATWRKILDRAAGGGNGAL